MDFSDPTVRERFIERDKSSATTADLAREFGVCSKTIQRWRARVGRARDRGPIHSQEVRDLAARFIADGCPIAEVARTVGAADVTVARWFPEAPRMSRVEIAQLGAAVRRLS